MSDENIAQARVLRAVLWMLSNTMDKKLTILTTPSQQIAVLDVANVLASVPPWTYERRFYPYSFSRLVFALLVSVMVIC